MDSGRELYTARQRVLYALNHIQPQRVPFSWNFGPTPEMAQVMKSYMQEQGVDWSVFSRIVDDVVQISPRYTGPALPENVDIWGIARKSQSYGNGSYDEIARYPIKGMLDHNQLKSYPWPDPSAFDDTHFRDEILSIDPEYQKAHKLAINVCGNPFEIYCWMTGLEEAMINLLLYPDEVHLVMDLITCYFEERLKRTLTQVSDLIDILYFADDLGGQNTLLLSIQTYRKMIKPYHARLFSLAHQLAPHASIMFHSDGAVYDILPDLIDAGINILEAVQTDAAGMEPERLKTSYGDILSFHGGISVQALLPFGDKATIENVCQNLVKIFGKNGGYIAAPSHAIQLGTPPENVLVMLQAVLGDDRYYQAINTSNRVNVELLST